MPIISSYSNEYDDILIRPEVDSYLAASVGTAPTDALVPTLGTLTVKDVSLTTFKQARSVSFASYVELNGSAVVPSDAIAVVLEDLETSLSDRTYLFGSVAGWGDYKVENQITKTPYCELYVSTASFSDAITTSDMTLNQSLPLANQQLLIPVMNCYLNGSMSGARSLHTLMKAIVPDKVIEEALPGSLYDNKDVPFGGQSFLPHTFIVIDEDFNNIISKTSGGLGPFTKDVFVPGTKVHVLAVPTDTTENIIPFRSIDISGVP